MEFSVGCFEVFLYYAEHYLVHALDFTDSVSECLDC